MNDQSLNSLSDGTYRARWLREVLRASQITESVKLMLISMGIEEMDPSGVVSVPREDLAARIGRGKSRVSERIQEAVDRGFLARLSAGKKSSTAVYAAAVSGSVCTDLIEDVAFGKGPVSRTVSEEVGSGQSDPNVAEKGPDSRTGTIFGSDLQDAEKGPDSRTRTSFGSDLQDAIEDDEVRVSGPNDPGKGPAIRAANVVEGTGEEVDPPSESSEEDFFKLDGVGSQATPAKRKTPVPRDIAITPDMRAWAAEKTPLVVDLEFETEQFVDHWTSKRELRADWVATWRTWMRNQQKWTAARQQPKGQSGNGSGSQVPPRGKPRQNPFRSKRESA